MAEEERAVAEGERYAALEPRLKLQLLPKDAADASSAIVEIRAGTGGDEAALFAADLLGMYQRYAQLQGWKTESCSASATAISAACKEAVLEVVGLGAYAKLKFESGVHRVQRVPVTEAGGRIHTSAATVAVLPGAGRSRRRLIDEKDLRIDVYRAQRRRRPARQQDGKRRAHHASADRHRRGAAGREIAAQEHAPRR